MAREQALRAAAPLPPRAAVEAGLEALRRSPRVERAARLVIELLTGAPPGELEAAMAVAVARLGASPAARLAAALLRISLAADPAARPSAAELADGLAAVVDALPGPGLEAVDLPPGGASGRRWRRSARWGR
ncbi:MAG: hypothetical protein R3F59_34005 [Myxococcota bacterium]